MSLALIQESAKEVRRLAIAGSPLAVGDFRLKKLIPPLEQAGAKVPVFAQVAKAINDLVNGAEADSSRNLLSLSTLLNAILYTQGQTAAEGDFHDMELYASKSLGTRTTARVLKPLIEALTSTGSGRFENVKSAVERGAFNDLRLIEPAIRALDDTYPELADLVAEKILPGYGPGIAPLVKQKLDLKGKTGAGRRLRVLHDLDSVGTVELCKTALEAGSPEVKAAAIACLGKHEDCLPLLMDQTKSKNKSLRAAALEALAEHDRPEVTGLFTEMIKGKSLDILAGPFRALRNRQVLNALLDEGKRVFNLLLEGDHFQLVRFAEIQDCLRPRKEGESEEFSLTCFGHCDKIMKLKAAKASDPLSGADITDRLAWHLYNIGSPKALEAILAKRDILPIGSFSLVLRGALRAWPADKVYTEFAPLLEQKKGAGKAKREVLEQTICAICSREFEGFQFQDVSAALQAALHQAAGNVFNISFHGRDVEEDLSEIEALKSVVWDARWLDAAIKADLQDAVCSLARPDHKAAITYLLKQLEAKNQVERGQIMQALARCQYPKITEVFLEQVTKKTKKAQYFDYDLQLLFASARYLPAADLPKLEALAANLNDEFADRLIEAIEPLRHPESKSE